MGSAAPGGKSTVRTSTSLPGMSPSSLSMSGVTTGSEARAGPNSRVARTTRIFTEDFTGHLVGFPVGCGSRQLTAAPIERLGLRDDVERCIQGCVALQFHALLPERRREQQVHRRLRGVTGHEALA